MATINGTNGNDDLDEILDGGSTNTNDVINGLDGDDTITVYPNFRPLVNGVAPVSDTVNGGDGNDTLKFTIGAPFLFSLLADPLGGYQGNYTQGQWSLNFTSIENFDVTFSAAGNITLGDGDDIVTDASGSEVTANTGAGNDTYIVLGNGQSNAYLGTGSDRLVIDVPADTFRFVMSDLVADAGGFTGSLFNNVGFNMNYSGINHFTVNGTNGTDTIKTASGDDIVNAGDANDTVVTTTGNDVLDGGAGIDTLGIDLSDETEGVTINLLLNGEQQSGGSGSIKGFESFLGTVTGSAFGDVFREGNYSFNATFNTGEGDDVVEVKAGNDVVNMGTGSDRLIISPPEDINRIVMSVPVADANGFSGTLFNNIGFNVEWSGVDHFTVDGTTGADTIRTATGDDVIDARGGNDILSVSQGNDIVDGGEGNDVLSIDLSDETQGVTINLLLNGEQQSGGSGSIKNVESFSGTVTGSAFGDTVRERSGFGESATFNMGGGNDTVQVSNGVDTVNGEAGNDRLVGEYTNTPGNINFFGALTGTLATGYSGSYGNSVGMATTFTGIENFTINTAGGADRVVTGDGNDNVSTGAGDDIVTLGRGNDVANGGTGTDRLNIDLSDETQGVSIDLLATGAQQTGGTGAISGFETFFGTVTGTAFNDVFREGNYNVGATFNTGAGDDLVQVSNGDDKVNMGPGNDRLVIDASASTVRIVMSVLTDDADGQTGSLFNNVGFNIDYTGVDNFTVTGSTGADTIRTGRGNDVVSAGDGADTVVLGRGIDSADGGAGIDTLSLDLSDQTSGVSIDLLATGEQQTGGVGSIKGFETFAGAVTGSAFDDVFREGNFNVSATFNTGAGNDTVQVANGSDIVNMGPGDDDHLVIDARAATNRIVMSVLTDDANGETGSMFNNVGFNTDYTGVDRFTVLGSTGGDTIRTGKGNDVVDGGAGVDIIDTGAGADTIAGLSQGTGLTRATGGTGSDTFAVAPDAFYGDATIDYITDFQFGTGGDLLDLTNWFGGDTEYLEGYEIGSDAFAGGFLRFIVGDGDGDGQQDDILLQADRDGGGSGFGFETAVVLQNVSAGSVNNGNVVLPSAPPPVNEAPVSVPDSFTVDEDGVVSGNVLTNDSDPDGDTLTATLVDDVSNGTFLFGPDGSFEFTPDPDFNGPVTFTYRANDGQVDGPLTTVTINVAAINDAPVANDDGPFATDFEAAITFDPAGLLDNDSDVDGDALQIASVQDATNGSVTLDDEGRPVFTPDAGFSGEASFTYSVSDGSEGGTSTATVTIVVGEEPDPDNTAPVAENDSYDVDEDGVLTIDVGVLANDSDVDEDALTAILVNGPAHGVLALAADGSFTYTPDANYNGPDSFTYRANDGSANSEVATVSITVNPVNDAPDARNDSGFNTAYQTAITFNPATQLLVNDTDIDGDTLSIQSVQGAVGGSVALNQQGRPVFTPDAGFSGAASFSYTISDGKGGVDTATVSLSVGSPPVDPGDLPNCPVVQRDGTVNGSAPTSDVLTGPAYHNSFYFDVAATTGKDQITNFQATDVLVTNAKIFDSNNDGIIMFGKNGLLNLDNQKTGDTVKIDGVAGLRFLGEGCDGVFVYADAKVRQAGWIEGTLRDDELKGDVGDSKAETFFFDTALDLNLGKDKIVNFGAKDQIVTTSALFDGNNDGIINFARNKLLDLSGGDGGPSDPGQPGEAGQIALVGLTGANGKPITSLQFDGTTTANGVTYYHYSLVDPTPPAALQGGGGANGLSYYQYSTTDDMQSGLLYA